MDERFSRYSGILAQELLVKQRVQIIGCGAIGSQIARQLATMGIGWIDLWDDDRITPTNLGTQGWSADSLDEYKTFELSRILRNLNPQCRVTTHETRWAARDWDNANPFSVFVALDNLEGRHEVAKAYAASAVSPIVVDSRMGALSMRIICPESAKHYAATIPTAKQVHEGPCTERATFFCASIAAGLAVATYAQCLRSGAPIERDFMVNLSSMEMFRSEDWDASKDAA